MNILIKNARIINPAERQDFKGNIYIEEGKIADIGETLPHREREAELIIEAEGLCAAPGLVDMHVHLRDPGFTDKEDILTAGKAAAAGGITSLLAMPNTSPAIDTPETVRYVLEKGEQSDVRVYTSACITKNLNGEELCDIPALCEAGAIALSDDGRPVTQGRHLIEALEIASKLGMLVCAHCEDLNIAEGGIMHEGEVSEKLGVKGIHRAAEDLGTAREIAAAASTDTQIHICHVSTKDSAAMIRAAQREGIQVSAETAPHYLLLTDELLKKKDADYRMNPPLRTEEDKLAIIDALRGGVISVIATDHAPHTVEEKSDFYTAPNGAIGMETSFAATLTALENKITLSEIIEKMSLNPAKLLKIPAGRINVGENADLILFDKDERWVVDEDKLHGKSKNTPFKGMELKGKIKTTICRGEIVYKDE